jgi:c-di-GMP-related signal transduction protein
MAEVSMELLVARQPIFDAQMRVFGYARVA